LDTLKRYLGREKKAAELETDFGRNKEYLEILCDSLEEAILVIDKNYKITYANLAALEVDYFYRPTKKQRKNL
jgi:PAS domain-containing protein